MSSHQMWMKLSVGIALAVMILPVFWTVWVTIEAGSGFSISTRVRLWKDRLLDFKGGVPEPGSDTGHCGGSSDQGKSGKFRRSKTLKEVFNSIRRSPRQEASTSSKLNLTRSNGSCGPPDGPGVEGEIKNKDQGSAV